MAQAQSMGVNRDYDPAPDEERIMDALQRGRNSDEPWGRATPAWFRKHADLKEPANVNFHLGQLKAAGWIKKEAAGCYEFVADPRKNHE